MCRDFSLDPECSRFVLVPVFTQPLRLKLVGRSPTLEGTGKVLENNKANWLMIATYGYEYLHTNKDDA
jgi:hypothetical protein